MRFYWVLGLCACSPNSTSIQETKITSIPGSRSIASLSVAEISQFCAESNSWRRIQYASTAGKATYCVLQGMKASVKSDAPAGICRRTIDVCMTEPVRRENISCPLEWLDQGTCKATIEELTNCLISMHTAQNASAARPAQEVCPGTVDEVLAVSASWTKSPVCSAVFACTKAPEVDPIAEAKARLLTIEKNIKVMYNTTTELPPSAIALPGVDGGACRLPGGHFAPTQEWATDVGWSRIGFRIDEPTKFNYHWTQQSPTRGYATAVADLDCDEKLITYRLDIKVTNGNIEATLTEPPPNSD